MKAICDFTRISVFTLQEGSFDVLPCFLPIMGKPWIQHCIESIERQGVKDISVYLSQYADEIERFIGDGERWGLRVTYHLVKRSVSVPERAASSTFLQGQERVLFCNLRAIPSLQEHHYSSSARFVSSKDTGWSWCTKEELSDQKSLPPVSVESYTLEDPQDYLDTLASVLASGGGNLIFFGKRLKDGIWAGPGCSISKDAILVPPIYIGSQARIGDGAIIGPHVEIGQRSIIDAQSVIIDSSLLSGSYVGKHLDVKRCIIHRSKVLHAAISAVYTSSDGQLLSAVASGSTTSGSSAVGMPFRLLAFLLAAVTLPVQVVLILYNLIKHSQGPLHEKVITVPQERMPGSLESLEVHSELSLVPPGEIRSPWSHLIWCVLPGLWTVAAGKKGVIGLPSRTPEQFQQLPPDWQGIYVKSRSGLISESILLDRDAQDADMLFASEMYQNANHSRKYNLKLLGRFVKALFSKRTQS